MTRAALFDVLNTFVSEGRDCVDGLHVPRDIARCAAFTLCARCWCGAVGTEGWSSLPADPPWGPAFHLELAPWEHLLAGHRRISAVVAADVEAAYVDDAIFTTIPHDALTALAHREGAARASEVLADQLRRAAPTLAAVSADVIARVFTQTAVAIVDPGDSGLAVDAVVHARWFTSLNDTLVARDRTPAIAVNVVPGLHHLVALGDGRQAPTVRVQI
jgi:hypothetical protein